MRWTGWARALIRLAVTSLLGAGIFLLVFHNAVPVRAFGVDLLRPLSGYTAGRALYEWMERLSPVDMALSASGLVLTVGLSWAWRARPRRSATPTDDAQEDHGRRRRIAITLRQNLDLLEVGMRWSTTMFTDFAVAIEMVRQPRRWWNPLSHTTAVVHRTESLTKALEQEPSRFILLQGPPGAGKSVAMRHYARTLLERAEHSSSDSPLPLWVNLRDFDVRGADLTVESFRAYLASQINPTGSPEIATYLRDDLQSDLAAGRAVLLLDSFDEIPAILGSSHVDAVVQQYLRVIVDFVGGGNARCVIAAREYKAPRPDWFTRFEIGGLQYEEQQALLQSAGLSREQLQDADPLLRDPRTGFAADLRNPLHLSLLAAYLQAHDGLPSTPSSLFEHYIQSQLSNLESLPPDEVQLLQRALASYAFELLDSAATGLAGNQEHLRTLIAREAPTGMVDRLVDLALRSGLFVRTSPREDAGIAFVHRRVQEYLGTRYVLDHPAKLDVAELALSGRWRETAVTLLHLGRRTDVLHEHLARVLAEQLAQARAATEFDWTSQAIHVLELLVSAYSSRPQRIPEQIVNLVSALVELGWQRGGIGDRKFALDCLPIVEQNLQHQLVEEAFAGESHWLRRSVLHDCATLAPLPDAIDAAIRRLLITLMANRQLSRDATAIDSDLRWLYQKQDLVRARFWLSILPRVVGISTIAMLALTVAGLSQPGTVDMGTAAAGFWALFLAFVGPLCFWQLQFSLSYSHDSRLRRYFAHILAGEQLRELTSKPWFLFFVLPFACGGGVLAIEDGQIVLGTLSIAAALFLILAVIWAISLLTGFHERRFTSQLRITEILMPFFRHAGAPKKHYRKRLRILLRSAVNGFVRFLKNPKNYLRKGLGYFLAWLLTILLSFVVSFFIFVVPIDFVSSLVDRTFGLKSGTSLFVSMGAAFIGYGLYWAMPRAIREARGWLRYRRRVKDVDEPTPSTMLAFMLDNPDPLDVADFLRRMRTEQPEVLRRLPRRFVRHLINVIEAETRSVTRHRDLDEPLRTALDDGRLSSETLQSWSSDVLDELGRIDQSLRNR